MKCEEFKMELPALLFGELSEGEREKLLKHIAECDECRREWKAMKSAEAVMMELGEEDPPTEMVFVEDKSFRVWRKTKEWLFAPAAVRWGLAAAAVLVALWITKPSISYKDGDFTLAFGKSAQTEEDAASEIENLLQNERMETLKLVSDMLTDYSEDQRREYTLTLTAFARELERKRQYDLKWMETGLQDIQNYSQTGIMQTNMVIEDLVKNASYSGRSFGR